MLVYQPVLSSESENELSDSLAGSAITLDGREEAPAAVRP